MVARPLEYQIDVHFGRLISIIYKSSCLQVLPFNT